MDYLIFTPTTIALGVELQKWMSVNMKEMVCYAKKKRRRNKNKRREKS